MPSDLFELARENERNLSEQCEATVNATSGDDRRALDAFGRLV